MPVGSEQPVMARSFAHLQVCVCVWLHVFMCVCVKSPERPRHQLIVSYSIFTVKVNKEKEGELNVLYIQLPVSQEWLPLPLTSTKCLISNILFSLSGLHIAWNSKAWFFFIKIRASFPKKLTKNMLKSTLSCNVKERVCSHQHSWCALCMLANQPTGKLMRWCIYTCKHPFINVVIVSTLSWRQELQRSIDRLLTIKLIGNCSDDRSIGLSNL